MLKLILIIYHVIIETKMDNTTVAQLRRWMIMFESF